MQPGLPRRLVLDQTDSDLAQAEAPGVPCRERRVAVLFSDLEASPPFSEHDSLMALFGLTGDDLPGPAWTPCGPVC